MQNGACLQGTGSARSPPGTRPCRCSRWGMPCLRSAVPAVQDMGQQSTARLSAGWNLAAAVGNACNGQGHNDLVHITLSIPKDGTARLPSPLRGWVSAGNTARTSRPQCPGTSPRAPAAAPAGPPASPSSASAAAARPPAAPPWPPAPRKWTSVPRRPRQPRRPLSAATSPASALPPAESRDENEVKLW